MEGRAEACGKSIKRGTRKFQTPVRTTLRAARIGLCGASGLAISMSGVPGNTARNGLKTALSIQNNDSRREIQRELRSAPV